MSDRVLIIDDDEVSLRFASSVLEVAGYEVHGVTSAMEAFDRLASHPPDLVLLDIVMPVISGLAVLEVVLRDLPNVPVILVTSLAADENVVRGLQLGADDYETGAPAFSWGAATYLDDTRDRSEVVALADRQLIEGRFQRRA